MMFLINRFYFVEFYTLVYYLCKSIGDENFFSQVSKTKMHLVVFIVLNNHVHTFIFGTLRIMSR